MEIHLSIISIANNSRSLKEKKRSKRSYSVIPAPSPTHRESALIMLADTIEAASRCLEEINEKTLTELVDNLVAEKLDDGQLNECQLTFEELGAAKKRLCPDFSSHRSLKGQIS